MALDFLGIGAQKAGTTWLYENLARHPGIAFPGGKEMHFWDAQRHLGLDWYRSVFASEARCAGEITPAYALLPDAVVAEIRRAFPDVRLIFLMRNPLDRAWSSALMAMRRAELDYAEVSPQWFHEHFRSRGSLARGDYLRSIEVWHRHFGEDRLLTLLFEDIVRKPREALERCIRHLGVDPAPLAAVPDEVLRQPVHAGPGIPMPGSMRAFLLDLYADRLAALEARFGRAVSQWRQEPGPQAG
jgi:hypothetical protein